MVYLNESRSVPAGYCVVGAIAARVARTVRAAVDAWHRACVYHETYEQLRRLSARELQDIGLSHGMISRVAYEAAYGRKA